MNTTSKIFINMIQKNLQFIIGCLILIVALSFLYQVFSNNSIEGYPNEIQIRMKSTTYEPIYVIPKFSSNTITNLFTSNSTYTLFKNNGSDSEYNLSINANTLKPIIVNSYGDNIMTCLFDLLIIVGNDNNIIDSFDLDIIYNSYDKPSNGSFGELSINCTPRSITPDKNTTLKFKIYLLDNILDSLIVNSIDLQHRYDLNLINGIKIEYYKTQPNSSKFSVYKNNTTPDILTNIDILSVIITIFQNFIPLFYSNSDNNKIHSVYFTNDTEKVNPLFSNILNSTINNRFVSGYILDFNTKYPCILEIVRS